MGGAVRTPSGRVEPFGLPLDLNRFARRRDLDAQPVDRGEQRAVLLPRRRIDVRVDQEQLGQLIPAQAEDLEPVEERTAVVPDLAGGGGVRRLGDGVENVGQRALRLGVVGEVRRVLRQVVGAVQQRPGQVAQADLGVFQRGQRRAQLRLRLAGQPSAGVEAPAGLGARQARVGPRDLRGELPRAAECAVGRVAGPVTAQRRGEVVGVATASGR